jgi:hypothetical protein
MLTLISYISLNILILNSDHEIVRYYQFHLKQGGSILFHCERGDSYLLDSS